MVRNAEMEIRPATAADIPAVSALWKELMDHHRRLDRLFTRRRYGHRIFARFIRKALRDPRTWVIFVAEAEGRVVGYLVGMIRGMPPPLKSARFGNVNDVCVGRRSRGRGAGRRLFEAFRAWCRRRRIGRIEVSYLPANRSGAAFWRRMGFRTLRVVGARSAGRARAH